MIKMFEKWHEEHPISLWEKVKEKKIFFIKK